MSVRRTERGWAGHFIGAPLCRFRRNTLLEAGETRIVISTVGLMDDPLKKNKGGGFMEIGWNRHFETMAFHAQRVANRYWDADVSRQVEFNAPWAIDTYDADDKANDMHEAVVSEITERLKQGETLDGGRGER